MSKYVPAIFKRGKQEPFSVTSLPYKYKTRFAMLGTVGSGKSTIAASIVLTSQTLSSQLPNFYCRVLESTSDILADASNLRRGRFPSKTQAYLPYAVESGLLLIWRGTFKEKKVQIPICDVAGEDIQQMIKKSRKRLAPQDFSTSLKLIKYVQDAGGFILVVPASRALLFHDDAQLERESDDLVADPDVNLARILSAVMEHKEQTKSTPIQGIAVVITKWDLIMPYAAQWGMDLYDPSGEGLRKFMDVCFPATNQALKPYISKDRVQFFPSHVQVMRNEDGSKVYWDGAKATDERIEVLQERRVPKYSEQSYRQLFKWLESFAT